MRNPSNLLLIRIDNINIYVKISSIYELPIVQIKYIFLYFIYLYYMIKQNEKDSRDRVSDFDRGGICN